ncbi:MAG: Ig-like domain-containing protein [Gemmatimonadota bacterium]
MSVFVNPHPDAMLLSRLTTVRRLFVALAAASFTLAGSACSDSVAANSDRVVAISIDPTALSLTTGATSALSATLVTDGGRQVPAADVHWSTENAQVAIVTRQGLVTAISPGKTQIAASKDGRSAIAPVTVSALPPALVRVIPTAATVFVGATIPLHAEVRDAGGGLVTGQTITWSSGTPAVASVNSSGVVTGVLPGNTVITARTAGLSGTAVVTVRLVPVAAVHVTPTSGTVPVNQTMQLTASLVDAAGNVLTGRPITWTSSDQRIATVSSGGLVRGRAKGTATITTTSEGQTATATISVQ